MKTRNGVVGMDHAREEKNSTGNTKPIKTKVFTRLEKCLYIWATLNDKKDQETNNRKENERVYISVEHVSIQVDSITQRQNNGYGTFHDQKNKVEEETKVNETD